MTASTEQNDRQQETAEAALKFLDAGLVPLPMHLPREDGSCTCQRADCSSPGKHPRGKWGEQVGKLNTAEAVRQAFRRPSNVGIATGRASDLWVLDIDGEQGPASLEKAGIDPWATPTPTVETGGGGFQLYFRYPTDGEGAPTRAGVLPKVDVRGDGGVVVAPPSIHVSGRPYSWMDGRSLDDLERADAPPALLQLMRSSPNTSAGMDGADNKHRVTRDEWLAVHAEGDRNDTLTRLVGSDISAGVPEEIVRRNAQLWNRTQHPPLLEAEVEGIVDSIWRREHSPLRTLGFSLEKQIQFGRGPDATFVWVANGERVEMGTAQDLLTLSRAQARLYSAGLELPSRIRAKSQWMPIVHAALEITEVQEVETRRESLESAVRGYLGSVHGLVVENLRDALANAPGTWGAYIERGTGEGLLRLAQFVEWCRLREDSRWTAEQVGRELSATGDWPLRQPRYGPHGRQVKARLIPIRLTREFLETAERVGAHESGRTLAALEAEASGPDAVRQFREHADAEKTLHRRYEGARQRRGGAR